MRDSNSNSVSTKLRRIAELARHHSEKALTTLAHHIDEEFLREAYHRTRKNSAAGIDGQTAAGYASDLERNLSSLLDRFKSGSYRAPPVRRVHIPKGDGQETRPIGIPTFEDKVLQRAVTMILEAVYEQDFLPCSFGFRPGRSAHQCLQTLYGELAKVRGGWVLEVDIEKFYDSIDHRILREILDKRVRDGVLRRVIHKWLKAGVLEEGVVRHPELGTPQGGVVSPILANVYLHEAIDQWFERDVKPRLRGSASLVRYADDFVMVFEQEEDARRVFAVLAKRLEKFGLRLHPTKTRLFHFLPPPKRTQARGEAAEGNSFEFLGFTHYWGRSRDGWWVVKRKTAPGRFTRAVRNVSEWIRTHRHLRVSAQHKMLSAKLLGHYQYYGITPNSCALERFVAEVRRVWHKWLNRRSQRKTMTWKRFVHLLERYPLPPPRIVHSTYRLAAKP